MNAAFIKFDVVPLRKFRLTRIWAVRNLRDIELGRVSWYAAWRKYCFVPAANCVFDHACLHAIAEFCEQQTGLHKEEKRDQRKRLEAMR